MRPPHERSSLLRAVALCLVGVGLPAVVTAQDATPLRARDLGVPFRGTPGAANAITDVPGVLVGHTTLISGEGALMRGSGPVRTGVTAILPRGRSDDPVYAGWYSLNGNGEMTGTTWIEESGFLEGPVMITNTHSVGVVRDAVVDWLVNQGFGQQPWALPVVAETYDGFLNDINGFHVRPEHAFAALDSASSGAVSEGAVGGGTGMICHSFKCGIGTSSRTVQVGDKTYTLGVLVQANYGGRPDLMVAGAPVGQEIPDLLPQRGASEESFDSFNDPDGRQGSIIVVVATDAPLLPHQLKRIARRAPLGIARMGGMASNGSGDIFVAFSTANPGAAASSTTVDVQTLANGRITPLFHATAYAVEEAITNALVAGRTLTGIDGNTVYGLPHDRLQQVLRKYGRLEIP